ncbi:MAG: TetR/AcrR family transcriptional regulator, partial [bacterium]|nr:TetR/AcrR family transcriptional regulator [bacterium]
AAEAGISEGVIFQRFPTKADLFFAAMIPPAPDVEALLDRASAIGDPCEQLEEMALAMLGHFRELMPILLPLVTHPSFQAHGFMERHHDGSNPTLEGGLCLHLERERSRGRIELEDPAAAAQLLVEALHTRALHERLEGGDAERSDERVRAMVRALWSGLAAAKGSNEGETK